MYLQICMQASRFSWLIRFVVRVQISFIKFKLRSTSTVDGGMSAASVSTLVILGYWIAHLNVIHCWGIISNKYVLFLDSDSYSFSSNLIDFLICQSLFIWTRNNFFWKLSSKTQFRKWVFLQYNGKKCSEWVLEMNVALKINGN